MSEIAFRARKGRKRAMINITSLIDVLFLLLIFFMLTGTFKRVGEMELQLPDSSTSAPASEGTESHQAELVLLEDGSLLLDGQPIDGGQLKSRLESIRSNNPDARILLKAETGANHGDVVRLLDMVREVGFAGVGIGTQLQGVPGSP